MGKKRTDERVRDTAAGNRPRKVVCDKISVQKQENLLNRREVHGIEYERNEGEERRGKYEDKV